MTQPNPYRNLPGTALKALLASITILPKNCGCNAKAEQMDRWGTVECIRRREEIIDWLKREEDNTGWLERLRASLAALTTGLAFKLNPLDPIPGIFDEAMRMAAVDPPTA